MKTIAFGSLRSATFCLLAALTFTLTAPTQPADKPRYVEGEQLVKFKGGPSGEAAKRVQSDLKHTVKRDFEFIGWQHIQLPLGVGVEEALARYQNHPDVLAVEPSFPTRPAFSTT
jgi:hypothetical protein